MAFARAFRPKLARGGGWTLSRGERHLMMRLLIRFAGEESGLTAVEYALIAGLMALGIIVSVSSVGTTISTKFYGPLSNGFS
jgi:pilus assembly protein Flp/PilA